MKIYSHSKLSMFEQCKLKYKFKYIDKIIPEIERSIEAHLGDSVHQALEWLYKQVKQKNIPPIDEFIALYGRIWGENYKTEIVVVKKNITPGDYFNQGIKFLVEYYLSNKPFKDNTIEIEKRIIINLDNNGKYKIQGFIDRIVHNLDKGEYEIHDYKTSSSLPLKEKVDNDRQLALYAIAIKELFGQDKEVSLVWHYLAHNKRLVSKRTNEQLEKLKEDTIDLIKEIETTKEFPPNKGPLCHWCRYKNICPAWGGRPPVQKNLKEFN